FEFSVDDTIWLEFPLQWVESIAEHELLRLDFDDLHIRAFLPIDILFDQPDDTEAESMRAAGFAEQAVWFSTLDTLPCDADSLSLRTLTSDNDAPGFIVLTDEASASLPESIPQSNEAIRLRIITTAAEMPAPGDILELTCANQRYLFPVTSIQADEAVDFSPPLPAVQQCVIISTELLFQRMDVEAAKATLQSAQLDSVRIARQRFDLLVFKSENVVAQIEELAFLSGHPLFWGNLPDDRTLFRALSDEQRHEPLPDLWQQALAPRFELGNNLERQDFAFTLPLAMPVIHDEATIRFAQYNTAYEDRIEKEGLKNFSAQLFFDTDLMNKSIATLPAEAFNKRYNQHRFLTGIHSLWFNEEITIIAAPDALQPGWKRIDIFLDIILPPELNIPVLQEKQLKLNWTSVNNAHRYEIQYSYFPDFHIVQERQSATTTDFIFELNVDCPRVHWFRIRAIVENKVGPWSNTVSTFYPESTFLDCNRIMMTAPDLQIDTSDPPDLMITWSPIDGIKNYELQIAGHSEGPAFEGVTKSTTTTETLHRSYVPEDTVLWLRVRALYGNTPGPWSNTKIAGSSKRSDYIVNSSDELTGAPEARAVALGLMRFCVARNDVFAVLAPPRHFDMQQTQRFKKDLLPGAKFDARESTSNIPPLSTADRRACSFAALYYPWIIRKQFAENDNTTLAVTEFPVLGAVAGIIARRSREQGAWYAPANQDIRGALGLTNPLNSLQQQQLFAVQINYIERNERGVMPFTEFTLMRDVEWQYLHVRRLMILLRKLATNTGYEAVFQSNNAAFRRQMQRYFEDVLHRLYQLGAFTGDTPEQAYRVIVDDSVNTQQTIDAGQFIIELRFAPSAPLMFLTVRLVQSSSGILVEEF
ncbi:MAG: phage tail sheath family protein, partial [Calditrichaeota bacterium]